MLPSPGVERCPDCGTEFQTDPAVGGLCPQCLLSLALLAPGAAPEEAHTAPAHLAPGRILGERYQIRDLLGRGGMGEVFRAFDLKLRVDVALKSVRADRALEKRSQELLRQEVRAAREVISPNVCRIFDLVVEDGQEFVSMEFIEGETLAETMRTRGPLVLKEAREIGAQFLAGLEAIHAVGLVHRDFKPENVMITQAGRVVVMDFGLARAWTTGRSETVSGTPAYMAPEQMRAEGLDARTDVFAAGIVLTEMLSVGGKSSLAHRQALWRAVRETPPRIPESPWAPALRRALAADPPERYTTARALARALEEVTQRLPGVDERKPYPGLSSFTGADAEYFFGREADIEALLQRLKRPRLLAVVGPSGAGKTSFLRAGVLPRLPATWGAVIATPGHRPFQALAHAIASSVAGDAEAVQQLLHFDDPDTVVSVFRRLRSRHAHVLVVLDQFEELFTLSPADVQAAFAMLLGRLVLEADCHVLLSMRDDFLLRCNAHQALAPAFSDLTPLGPLGDSGLRRALVQPALACGYQFEDEALVDQMVAEVSREHGALPLLAFAASRLWEQRDRERGLLTRRAYEDIGGVGGALARHAEATFGRIGMAREPVVRELFRNLVTAQGTREVRDRGDLLSVFPVVSAPGTGNRTEAAEVVDALVNARLLTAFEEAGETGGPQQIEIAHEALLQAWPRLVRWQTQDADGEQLRHQLRQAAQLWNDRGRSEDLLWSGTAYRDFALWRERYAGGLTGTEEAFAEAAARRNGRRRRRRRMAVAAALSVATLVAAGATALYRQADRARQRAEAETRRAEAGRLLVLGERDLDRHPTGALAYALKSLELADTSAGRMLALRVLQQSPVARIAPVPNSSATIRTFSPDGEWLATSGFDSVSVFRRSGGDAHTVMQYPSKGVALVSIGFQAAGVLVANLRGDVRLWSVAENRELLRLHLGYTWSHLTDHGILTETVSDTPGSREASVGFWAYDKNGQQKALGTMRFQEVDDVTSSWMAYGEGQQVYLRSLAEWTAPPRLVGDLASKVQEVVISHDGSRLAATDDSGVIGIWATNGSTRRPERVLHVPGRAGIRLDRTGQRLAAALMIDGRPTVQVFDLANPSGTEPLVISRGDSLGHQNDASFDPSGQWVSTSSGEEAEMWWIGGLRPQVRVFPDENATHFVFTPDGRWLIAAFNSGLVRALPMNAGDEPRTIFSMVANWKNVVAVHPSGRQAVVGLDRGRLFLIDLENGRTRALAGFSERTAIGAVAFGGEGRLLAAAPGVGPREEKVLRVFDLDSGSVRTFGPLPGSGDGVNGGIRTLTFVGTTRVMAFIEGTGLVSVDLRSGASQLVAVQPNARLELTPDGQSGVGLQQAGAQSNSTSVLPFRTESGALVALEGYDNPTEMALDPSGRLVATGGLDGSVRVGLLAGGEPHVLTGHAGAITALVFSPDGRWLASSATDKSIQFWPVPDVSRTPLHKLPYEELLSLIRAQTNLRAIRDEKSDTGYTLKPGPFPGWANPPPQ